ncbi:MAG TPA: TOBE domain-containing protein, partial [Afipia sp.]
DRIGVMDKGHLVQVASPRELYEAPNSRWIAGFVGDINLIEGRVTAIHREFDRVTIATAEAGLIVAARTQVVGAGDNVCVAIRPEKIALTRADEEAAIAINSLAGELVEIGYLGSLSSYRVRLDTGAVLRVVQPNASRLADNRFAAGQRIVVSFLPDDAVVLDQ